MFALRIQTALRAPMFLLRTLMGVIAFVGMSRMGAVSLLAAETTAIAPPALPAWPDQAKSVYAPAAAETAPPTPQPTPRAAVRIEPVAPASFAVPPTAAPVTEAAPVIQSAHVVEKAADDPRRLAPKRNHQLTHVGEHEHEEFGSTSLPSFGLPIDSIYTTGTALAVVVGLFLLSAGLIRRGAKKSNAMLPEEVVSVLGRVPLAPRQFAELVRVGNKLVLLSITQSGAEPLTEITDPVEIDRLVGLCRERSKGSSTVEFDQVFRKLAEETAPAGFLGNEVPRMDARLAPPTDVFAAYRRGARSA